MSTPLLSTSDNPFNPHTEFDEWYQYDVARGHNTLAFLGRLVRTAPDMTQAEEIQAYKDAVSEIVRENITGLYIEVYPPE